MLSASANLAVCEALSNGAREQQLFERELRRHELESTSARAFVQSTIMPNLRRASVGEYEAWLELYLNNGGKISHAYNYPMPGDFYIAERNFEMVPLYGSMSIRVIAPAGIEVTGDLGHCNVYQLADGSQRGSFVAVYSNMGKDRVGKRWAKHDRCRLSPQWRTLIAERLAEAEEEDVRWQREHDIEYARTTFEAESARELLRWTTRPARVCDYERWLEGYVAKGGKITHAYDYPMPDKFYVAFRDLELPPLYGSSSVSVIVPEGISVTGIRGHNDIFRMEGFTRDSLIVPVYSNVGCCCSSRTRH